MSYTISIVIKFEERFLIKVTKYPNILQLQGSGASPLESPHSVLTQLKTLIETLLIQGGFTP